MSMWFHRHVWQEYTRTRTMFEVTILFRCAGCPKMKTVTMPGEPAEPDR